MKSILAGALAVLLSGPASAPSLAAGTALIMDAEIGQMKMEPFEGAPTVSDGLSLKFGTTKVKLLGVDPPQNGQCCHEGDGSVPCLQVAEGILARAIGGREVSCEAVMVDRIRHRPVAICVFADGSSVNELVVKAGLAASASESSPVFAAAESEAKQARRRLWGMGFQDPSAWRQSRMAGKASPLCQFQDGAITTLGN